MNFNQLIRRALQEKTLADALSITATFENERAVKQAVECYRTGKSTTGDDSKWNTCFKFLFNEVIIAWNKKKHLEMTYDLNFEAGGGNP